MRFADIPGPPLLSTALALLAPSRLHEHVHGRHRRLGAVFRERLGPVDAVFVAEPRELRAVFDREGAHPRHALPDAWTRYNRARGCPRGLFFMEGAQWWHHRRIMNRLLLRGDLRWIEDACDYVSDGLVDNLLKDEGSHCVNLESKLYKWSLDVIVAILLGGKSYKRLSNELEKETVKLAEIVRLVFHTSAKLTMIPASFASKYNIPRWKNFVLSVDNALTNANSLVDKLKDKLSPESEGLLIKLLSEDIESDNIKRIIVDLILAAGDTTAYALEWMLYQISKNKNHQQELRSNPNFVKFVFKETLRLYPVAPFLTRILPEDSIICGYEIPKDTLIVLSIYTTGRDGKYFSNPETFEPGRWDKNHPDYNSDMQKASLPFAMGLRSCVGRKIAETQLNNALLKIVNNFDIECGNDREVKIKLKMVAVPSEPIKLRFKKL